MTTKIETVTVAEDVQTDIDQGHNRLHAGDYCIEMPADYDASTVTGEDILLDGALTIVE